MSKRGARKERGRSAAGPDTLLEEERAAGDEAVATKTRTAKTRPAKSGNGAPAQRRGTGARRFNRRTQTSPRPAGRRARAEWAVGVDPWELLLGIRERLRPVPRAAWVCAAVAFANAACWSILTPPFQVTDEPSHFAYVQQLAENERLPTSSEGSFSAEESAALRDLNQYNIRESPETPAISTAQAALLQEDLNRHPSRRGTGGVGGAYSYPPLYYMLEVVPYGLASGGTLLDQLEAMRLLSALMAGVTALFAFLFIREALPGARWAWTVGGLGVALAPLLAFISGGVNPDSMLTAVSAASFYCLALAFRRGLTRNLAVAIGAVLAVGVLTKPNFIGLAPGILLGLVLLTVRASRTHGRVAYTWLGLALSILLAPALLYVIVNVLAGHPALGSVSTSLKLKGVHGSILTKISYVWQLYLPRLPGMSDYFPGLSTFRGLWFNRGVGFYGWLDTTFPQWVDNAAILPATAIALLCARSLVAGRSALRTRIAEVAVYGVMTLGLLALIGVSSYVNRSEGLFSDPRYLLPLIPLFGAGLALAARGCGRRLGPAAGALIVLLVLSHDVFSQLLVVGRYYI